jgi:hypothetical protein
MATRHRNDNPIRRFVATIDRRPHRDELKR